MHQHLFYRVLVFGKGKDGGAFGVTGHPDSGQLEVLGYTLRGA